MNSAQDQDRTIAQTDVFELLGLNNLPQEEKNKMVEVMARAALKRGFENYILEKNLDDETLTEIEATLNSGQDSLAIQNELVRQFPDLPIYVQNTAVDIKTDAFRKQLEDMLTNVVPKLESERQSEFSTLIDNLQHSLQRQDDDDFFENWDKYNTFKQQHLSGSSSSSNTA